MPKIVSPRRFEILAPQDGVYVVEDQDPEVAHPEVCRCSSEEAAVFVRDALIFYMEHVE